MVVDIPEYEGPQCDTGEFTSLPGPRLDNVGHAPRFDMQNKSTSSLLTTARPGRIFPTRKQASMSNWPSTISVNVTTIAATSRHVFSSIVVVGKLIAFELALGAQPDPNSFRAQASIEARRETMRNSNEDRYISKSRGNMYTYM